MRHTSTEPSTRRAPNTFKILLRAVRPETLRVLSGAEADVDPILQPKGGRTVDVVFRAVQFAPGANAGTEGSSNARGRCPGTIHTPKLTH